jgi:hypothetical protein
MILKLLKQKGVLSEGEYQAAVASELNVAGLQRKIDQSVNQPPVFSAPSSAQKQLPETPESGPPPSPEAGKTSPGSDGAAAQPGAPPEQTLPEKR